MPAAPLFPQNSGEGTFPNRVAREPSGALARCRAPFTRSRPVSERRGSLPALRSSRLAGVEGFFARRWVLAGVVLAVIAIVAPTFLLGAAPVLGLVLVLAAGWFPGEKVIARLRDRGADPRRTPARGRVIARHRVVRRSSRLLICFSLANRPPPLLRHA